MTSKRAYDAAQRAVARLTKLQKRGLTTAAQDRELSRQRAIMQAHDDSGLVTIRTRGLS